MRIVRRMGIVVALVCGTWIAPAPARAGNAFVGFTASMQTTAMWSEAVCGAPCPDTGQWSFSVAATGQHNGDPSTNISISANGGWVGACEFATGTGTISIGREAFDDIEWILVGGSNMWFFGGGGTHPVIYGQAWVRPIVGGCILTPASEWQFTGFLAFG